MTNLPNSRDEKKGSDGWGGYPHWIYVHELKALLTELKDDDWLTPNQVSNLSIGRGDINTIGIVDLYWNRLEWFNDEEE